MSLNQEMQDVIAKNLPQLAAAELKTFIEQAEKDKIRLRDALAENANNIETISKLNAKIRTQTEIDEQSNKIATDRADLVKREEALLVASVKNEVLVVRAELQGTTATAKLFLANRQFRESVLESRTVPVEGASASQYNPNGSPGYPHKADDHKHTTGEEG